MKYRYVAMDTNGKKEKGIIDAENETAVIYHLRNQDLSPISVSPYKEKAEHFWEVEIMEPDVHKLKMKKKDLMQFADKMSIMLRAGVTLSMAMDVIVNSEKNRRYKKIYRAILTDLYGGASLADSMRTFKAFPEVFVNMIASGEKTGKLDWSFAKISEVYSKQMTLSSKISGAFSYPGFLFGLMIVLFVIMTTVVLPKFSNMYDTFGAELPGITLFVMGISDFLLKYGLYLLAGVLLIALIIYLLLRFNPEFAKWTAMLTLRLPVFGRLALVSNTCNFSQISAALLMSGVEVVEAVRIAASVVKNSFLRGSISSSLESVAQGSKLHTAFNKLHIFEPLFISMIQIGEEASMLPDTFQKMADLYEAESNDATQKMTAVLEPIMTMSIGLVIALLVISIILPMFDMYSVVLQ
jgi:type IV pilus assembly protein PilC